MDNLSAKLEELKARFDESDGLLPNDKTFIEENYQRITFRKFTRRHCGSCYRDAFIEMYVRYKKYGIKQMGKYILKRGVLLHTGGEAYTNANLTDEVARRLLQENPNRIGLFETYPEDWQKEPRAKNQEPRVKTKEKKSDRRYTETQKKEEQR